MRLLPAAMLLLVSAASLAAAQPPLPEGLDEEGRDASQEGGEDEAAPAPPEGLDDEQEPRGPALPEGLGGEAEGDEASEPEPEPGVLERWNVSGFLDARAGARVREPVDQERFVLAETRLQLKALRTWNDVTGTVRIDLLGDAVAETQRPDLEEGEGFVDLREAHLLWRTAPWLDLKLGRQILTWGTGEFLFLNDLFPKDFRSFFIGRRDIYLKAPSDAIKASLFSDLLNLDLVYTPRFDADRFVDGSRLSYFNPFTRSIVGDEMVLRVERPEDVWRDDELAARLHRLFRAYELALYGYDGFWKSPVGLLPGTGRARFPRLSAYGASVRGPVLGGIASFELSYYDSREDREGDDPTVPNSQLRLLVGFEREVATNLTGAVQYYLERRIHHDALEETWPRAAPLPSENRHLLTFKLVNDWPERQIRATLFLFYSPSENDGYLRPRLSWDATDALAFEAGLNWLFGEDDSTEFGQLRDNSNVFLGVRYGF